MKSTTCPANHQRKSLCCKSGVEYEQYYLARERNATYRYDNVFRVCVIVYSYPMFSTSLKCECIGKFMIMVIVPLSHVQEYGADINFDHAGPQIHAITMMDVVFIACTSNVSFRILMKGGQKYVNSNFGGACNRGA